MWPAGRAPGRTRACVGGARWCARPPGNPAGHTFPVEGPLSTEQLAQRICDQVASGAVVLALHEAATDRLADLALAQANSLMLVVGPEGGIAPDEIAALTDAGAVAVRLGPTVLRTSSAAAVALGALGVLTPRWD